MIPFVVFLVFLVLKLTGVIDWSWWWVTAPLWVTFVVPLVLELAGCAVGSFIQGVLGGSWLVGAEGRRAVENWCKRHLNWTWVLTYLLWWSINVWADVSEVAWWLSLVAATFWLIVSGWVIRQKGRRLWWVLLAWIGSPLWLRNKKTQLEQTLTV